MIQTLSAQPRKLFLVDSIGALLTAVMLSVVVRKFHTFFGMPPLVLTYLSAVAAIFCIYSAGCFIFLKRGWASFIRAIAIANLSYAALSLVLVVINYSSLTVWGVTYFLAEVVVICALVVVEFRVASAGSLPDQIAK